MGAGQCVARVGALGAVQFPGGARPQPAAPLLDFPLTKRTAGYVGTDFAATKHIDKSCIGADYAVRWRVRAMMHLSYAFRQV